MIAQETATEPGLREYLQVLRRRKPVIALTTAFLLAVAIAVSSLQTPRYAATAKLLLRQRSGESLFNGNSQSYVDPVRSVQTEIEVIRTEPVQDLVRKTLGSAPPVQVRPVGQTDLVMIRAESTQAPRAAQIANAYANGYIEFRRKQAIEDLAAASEEVQTKITDIQQQIESLASTTANLPACVDARTTPDACTQRSVADATVSQRRTTLISQLGLFQQRLDQLQVDSALVNGGAQLVTPASTPAVPFEPTPRRNAVLAGIIGLLLGVALAFLVEYLDDSIKAKEDLERAVPGLGVLGLIPLVSDWKSREQSRVVSLSEPTSPAAEAYRILRTSIQFLGIDRQVRLIQVTSASAQEGKTTTLANLAVAFASSGMRTVAVCCDLRRPRLHEFFNLDNAVGFTSVLLGNVALAKALQPVPGQERLLVLASGPLPPNPAELLSSSRTADLLGNLATQADIVLIDSPPVLPVTDSLVLSQRVDTTVLVGAAGTTTRKAAQRAVEMLNQVNAPLVGAVLNGVTEHTGYGGYSSSYYATEHIAGSHAPRNGNGSGGRAARWRGDRTDLAG
ncbi:MAG: polysaccharide biosynthesis tyrosine autokinase [Actinomycetota bacterium]|nr:polysaccharide biosynthesis tyrosine autokinase [Actinomycetota bacterium]